jgi:hypothetical protein
MTLTLAVEWLRKYWAYLVIVIAFLVGTYLIYNAGYTKAAMIGQHNIDVMLQAAADEKAKLQADLRGVQLASSARAAQLDKEGAANAEQIRQDADKTIADLSAGNLRLRKRLAAVEQKPGSSPNSGPSTGVGGAGSVQTVGLRVDDAQFLVRRSNDADLRANALKTCVAQYNAARQTALDWYKSHGTSSQ